MKVAVIGDPIRKERDLYLVERIKKKFSECLYIPIDKIRFEIRKRMEVRFGSKKLNTFDFVFPIPTNKHKENFYIILRMLSEPATPFTASQYLLLVNGLAYDLLEKKGIYLRKSIVIASHTVLDKLSNEIKFPLIVKQKGRKVLVTNITTLKHVVSLFKPGTPIKLEFPLKSEKAIYGILIGEDIFFCGVRKKKVERKVEKKEKKEVEEIASKIKNTLDLDYFSFKLLKCGNFVLDWISLSPNFKALEKFTRRKICEKIANFIQKKVEASFFRIKISNLLKGLLKK